MSAISTNSNPSVNPFAVSKTGLGCIDFVFDSEPKLSTILHDLRQSNWNGQIVGPHGSGKSTLTVAIARALRNEFESFHWVVMMPCPWPWQASPVREQMQWTTNSTKQDSLDDSQLELLEPWNESTIFAARTNQNITSLADLLNQPESFLIVDGCELVSWWHRRALIRNATRRGRPLLLTTHRKLRFGPAVIAELRPSLKRFASVVAQLQTRSPFQLDSSVVQQSFTDSNGDMRAALGRLYDRYEEQRLELD